MGWVREDSFVGVYQASLWPGLYHLRVVGLALTWQDVLEMKFSLVQTRVLAGKASRIFRGQASLFVGCLQHVEGATHNTPGGCHSPFHGQGHE